MFFRTPAGLHLLLFFLLLPLDRQDHIVSAKEPEMRWKGNEPKAEIFDLHFLFFNLISLFFYLYSHPVLQEFNIELYGGYKVIEK